MAPRCRGLRDSSSDDESIGNVLSMYLKPYKPVLRIKVVAYHSAENRGECLQIVKGIVGFRSHCKATKIIIVLAFLSVLG